MRKIASALVALVCLLSCGKKDIASGTPSCIENKIKEIAGGEVWNPPAKVFRYLYKNETVYYISPRCCDFPSVLLDEKCTAICSPDGGITGQGDGLCSDFFDVRTNEKLIWEDKREK